MRLLLIVLIMLISKLSLAQRLVVLTEDLPPYQYQDEYHQATGYAVELVKAILARANLDTQIKVVPWARGYNQALKQKNVILFSMVRTKERENLFKWIGEVDQLRYFLYKLSSRTDLKIKSLDQAKGYKVGVSKASFEFEKLKSLGFAHLTTSVKYANLLDMLIAKRFDILFASQGPLEIVINNSRHNPSNIQTAYEVKQINQKLFIALSKSSDESLAIRLREAYKAVVASGEQAKLMHRWLGKI